MTVLPAAEASFAITIPIVIIGGGACGLVAALAATDLGAEVLVLERDSIPSGSTALSSGMIPACGTMLQKANGVSDNIELMRADLTEKAKGQADPVIVQAVCETSGPAIDWLMKRHGIDLELVEGFLYSGHSALRMHAPPSKTGEALMTELSRATDRAGIRILTDAHVIDLFADPDSFVRGVKIERPDGSIEDIGCKVLILACNGFGGNKEMVRRHIPEMADALYFGHDGNRGDAVDWGSSLGGEAVHMTAYQGHGSVATPHGILVTWALMMAGGIQVNADGDRFSDEHQGYSEQSVAVLSQPGKFAWCIYDRRLHELGLEFDDYRNAVELGATKTATTVAKLAALTKLSAERLERSIEETKRGDTDRFGRNHGKMPALKAPYFGIKVTGALFHTQGGLRIDRNARVLARASNMPLPNLFAGGGAACGVSGTDVSGYLSGNGLLTAVMLGRIAGKGAAIQVMDDQ